MDRLQTHRDAICRGLCASPDLILDLCGDILLMKQYRHLVKQPSDLEKMEVLLDSIVQNGEPACQTFTEVVQQNLQQYPSLQQLFSSTHGDMETFADGGSVITKRKFEKMKANSINMKIQTVANPGRAPSDMETFADGGSVITNRNFKKMKANSVNMKIQTVANPGRAPSGSAPGPGQQAKYQALGGSVICLDQFHDVTVNRDLDLSVCVTSPAAKPQKSTGRKDAVDVAPPSSQEPAVDFIRHNKTALIECLSADLFILQYIDEKGIVSQRKYNNLYALQLPENTVIDLIDAVIAGGQKTCTQFLELLQEPRVAEDFKKLAGILKAWCPGPEDTTDTP